jgi:two-component sensor histidine kinase
VSVFSHPDDPEAAWLLHAEAVVGSAAQAPTADLSTWPPAGAVATDVSDAYETLAARGYEYGPAFRALTAMWRRGDEVFAEVTIPQDVHSGDFGVHPVLLDASMHAIALAVGDHELALPFSWQQVSLHAAGASSVRARIAPVGPNSVSIDLADGLGLPVLSVGSMHQQLLPGGQGAVELRAYFTQLCQSLAASMIPDPKLVTLTVKADEAWLDAEDSVSLGLIVTELTINALKHAFPGGRGGDIVVEYRIGSGVGTLSVSDNGVGMLVGMKGSKPGLGTSIVDALVHQLRGELTVSDNAPGTRVTVVNRSAQLQAPVAA